MLSALIIGCSATQYLPEGAVLLHKNMVVVDNEIAVDSVENIIQPKPNKRFLGIPFGLLLYQSANERAPIEFDQWIAKKPKRQKRMQALWSEKQVAKMKNYKLGFQQWKKNTGEPPVITDTLLRTSNANKLRSFFSNEGYFNVAVATKAETSNQKAKVHYNVETNTPYFLDSINATIESPVLDSIYRATSAQSTLKKGNRYRTNDFEQERNRLFTLFRNAGVYPFQLNSIDFSVGIDSTGFDYRLPVDINIRNHIENQDGITAEKTYKVSKMNTLKVFVGNPGDTGSNPYDSIGVFNGIHFYSQGKMHYSKRLLRDAIPFKSTDLYSDNARSLTLRQLTRLQSFDYPTIRYDYADEEETLLDASIYLTPKKRYSLNFGLDLTQSNILKRGIAFSSGLSVLNVFGGAETLEIGSRGSLGRSSDVAISEFAFDVQLRAPQFLLPFARKLNKQKIAPQTIFRVGSATQKNIGLDKKSLTGSIQYKWSPKKKRKWAFSLAEVEFVNNQNKENYFGVYTNAYSELNAIALDADTNPDYMQNNKLIIPLGAQSFIQDVISGNTNLTQRDVAFNRVQRIEERRSRLTQNNLIFSSGIQYFNSSKSGAFDKEFTQFRANISWAGNLLQAIAKPFKLVQSDGEYLFLDVPFSQYVKIETDWVKHWRISDSQVLAARGFAGVAIPYGNADNIPFNRSFFAGGAYDNRAWEVYRLGPGSSDTGNEFNEANLKLAFNVEYRFDLIGSLKGGLFVDVGNIWNVADNVKEDTRRFDGFQDLNELALGSGFGFRYDFGLFLLRVDMGFKTHNPVLPEGDRWNFNYALNNANPTLGINYPF